MITVEQLYAGTREGLDIILSVYPQAEVCVSNPKAKIQGTRIRTNAVCYVKATTDKNGNRVWKMIDYGDERACTFTSGRLDERARHQSIRRSCIANC